ncbi:MAG: hypothetical protein GY786_04795 [Proteobacteria bacterium]|nr:hypothetical protein [Pseudomonadota bacterium]
MISRVKTGIVFLFLLTFSRALSASVLFELDFSLTTGNVEDWFERNHWEIQGTISNMNPRFGSEGLILEPVSDDRVIIGKKLKPEEFLKGVKQIKIEWGVAQFPTGADWRGPKDKKRNNQEAIAVLISFGVEKIDSGSFFLPDAPYFLGFFLGEKERPGNVYYANYYQEGGRFFCEPCDGSIGNYLTIVNLEEKFNEMFSFTAPPITAISFEVDVENTEKINGRYSKAFIRKITFLH